MAINIQETPESLQDQLGGISHTDELEFFCDGIDNLARAPNGMLIYETKRNPGNKYSSIEEFLSVEGGEKIAALGVEHGFPDLISTITRAEQLLEDSRKNGVATTMGTVVETPGKIRFSYMAELIRLFTLAYSQSGMHITNSNSEAEIRDWFVSKGYFRHWDTRAMCLSEMIGNAAYYGNGQNAGHSIMIGLKAHYGKNGVLYLIKDKGMTPFDIEGMDAHFREDDEFVGGYRPEGIKRDGEHFGTGLRQAWENECAIVTF